MQQCWGIKGKQSQQYGDSILRVIDSYLQRHTSTPKSGAAGTVSEQYPQKSSGQSPKKNIEAASNSATILHGESDDDIETGTTLSIEEIVAQRVREAETRGEVFEIL